MKVDVTKSHSAYPGRTAFDSLKHFSFRLCLRLINFSFCGFSDHLSTNYSLNDGWVTR